MRNKLGRNREKKPVAKNNVTWQETRKKQKKPHEKKNDRICSVGYKR